MKKVKRNFIFLKTILTIIFIVALCFGGINIFFATNNNVFASTSIPSGNFLIFSSETKFTINAEKNWDGIIQYSNDGETWSVYAGISTLTSTQIGESGPFLLWFRGKNNTRISSNSLGNSSSWEIVGSEVECFGNIETLIDYNETDFNEHPFMDKYCFKGMFANCTSLITAPTLASTNLSTSCYEGMFENCTSLTQTPKFLATTLANYCYSSMFKGCTSLNKIAELPEKALADGCYYQMFYNCTALKNAPKLPATSLAISCYEGMFEGCTSLTQAPNLKATTLKENCYKSMFSGCTNIKLSIADTGGTPWIIPTSDTYPTGWNDNMFNNRTDGFPSTPTLKTYYYTNIFSINYYNATDGVNGVTNPNQTTYNADEETEIVLQNPSKEGFTFVGWKNSDNETVTSISTTPTGLKRVDAEWQLNRYALYTELSNVSHQTYVADPDDFLTILKHNQQFEIYLRSYGPYTLPETITLTRENYILSADTDYTYVVTNGSGKITIFADTITGPITISASGVLRTYTVDYNTNGGEAIDDLQLVGKNTINNEKESFAMPIPIRPGYEFVGWFYRLELGDEIFYLGQDYINTFLIPNAEEPYVGSDLSSNLYISSNAIKVMNSLHVLNLFDFGDPEIYTFVAKWKVSQQSITYVNAVNGLESVTNTNPVLYTVEDEAITLANPTKQGYTFVGWTTSENSTPTTEIAITQGSAGDLVFVANWKLTKQSITYVNAVNGLESVTNTNPVLYTIEDEAITLANPTKQGYTFVGWTTSENSTPTTEIAITQGSAGDLVFVANWTKDSANLLWLWILLGSFGIVVVITFLWMFKFKRTIKFFMNGTKIDIAKYKSGEEIKLPTNLSKYKWFTNKEQTEFFTRQKMGMFGFSVYGTIKNENKTQKKPKNEK